MLGNLTSQNCGERLVKTSLKIKGVDKYLLCDDSASSTAARIVYTRIVDTIRLKNILTLMNDSVIALLLGRVTILV